MTTPTIERTPEMQAAIDEQVRLIFREAEQFRAAEHALKTWAEAHGWIFAQHSSTDFWFTRSVAPETAGYNGPRFESFGALMLWLFTDSNDWTPPGMQS